MASSRRETSGSADEAGKDLFMWLAPPDTTDGGQRHQSGGRNVRSCCRERDDGIATSTWRGNTTMREVQREYVKASQIRDAQRKLIIPRIAVPGRPR